MSKITDCFLLDNTRSTALNVYSTDTEARTYYATRYGVESQRGKSAVNVPMFPFTDIELQDRCVLLLLEAIKDVGWKNLNAFEDAESVFESRQVNLHTVLTSADHHLIPPGRRVAVADPEQLGRIVEANGQRGVVLFAPWAVLGCEKKAKTGFELVFSDVLAFG